MVASWWRLSDAFSNATRSKLDAQRGGMTADAAPEGAANWDLKGTVGIIGAESHGPHNQRPLFKELWREHRTPQSSSGGGR
jgi:hypothetical protein